MPQPLRSKGRETYEDMSWPNGFDVTCSIGRVTFGNGQETARVAAFKLIAEHGTDGDFSFPSEKGGTIHVIVDSDNNNNAASEANPK
jgi:hypothetical protein